MIDATGLEQLSSRVISCRRCPRLVAWREETARAKRAAFADEEYWGKAVPGFGDPEAWLLIVGLAPAAHGANRTGRMFTGDRSGDFLYAALHRAGLSNQAEATSLRDGLRLEGAYITASVRCAPPGNRPTTQERDNCRGYLEDELDLLPSIRVILTLGGFAFSNVLRILRARGLALPSPLPRFAHARVLEIPAAPVVVASYHPSQQNTFTGRLTPEMMDSVLVRARGSARGTLEG
ncbi:MAG: uracil-DNA glycosylase [Candidatus Palauibacterales bacterium]|nr:uracil-DNA glycosylase [Candidatus Palauibacterales bacterium]